MKNKFSAEYICGLSFADETELFRTPAEVIAGESVTLRLRTAAGGPLGRAGAAGAPVPAWLVTDGGDPQPLHHTGREARFDWHTLTLRCPEETLRWNAKALAFDDNPAATALLRRTYRTGW